MPEAFNFIKIETLAQVFSCEFCKISKNSFLHRTPLLIVSGDCNNQPHFLYELVYCVCSGLFIRLAVDEIKWKDRTRVAVGGVLLHMKKDILAH